MLLAQCGQSQVQEAIFATKALPSLAQKLMLSAYSAEHSGHCFMGHSESNGPIASRATFAKVMYYIVCKFWWERGNGEENGFHIWPRKEDLEVVEGKA